MMATTAMQLAIDALAINMQVAADELNYQKKYVHVLTS
jgi:hypothetical protein